jgi:hypothetical protein
MLGRGSGKHWSWKRKVITQGAQRSLLVCPRHGKRKETLSTEIQKAASESQPVAQPNNSCGPCHGERCSGNPWWGQTLGIALELASPSSYEAVGRQAPAFMI